MNIPLPKKHKKEKRLIQVEVSMDLWKAVEKAMKKDGATIRSVVEFGLLNYLSVVDPKAASSLVTIHE